MVPRMIRRKLVALARRFPVVTVTGPRQSGKTTLCRATFPRKRYVTLEAPDVREFATSDPRGFLHELREGAILDEIQRAPALLSYLQGEVDERPLPGRFILTGSANFALMPGLSQSLAGRTAVLQLLPLAHPEVCKFPHPPIELMETLWAGGYPAVFERGIAPPDWFSSYVATYLERDVRQLLNVGDLAAFQTFVRVCAGRTGQLLNLSALGADCGITHVTAKAWLSVLEASFIVHRLPALHANVTARLVKAPKLHFYDTGLVCYLLGIRSAGELRGHPLRGAIFETWVVSEVLKARLNQGLPPSLSYYRDRKSLEIDLVLEAGGTMTAVEVKSGATIASDFFKSLDAFADHLGAERSPPRRVLVYGGDVSQRRNGTTVVPWSLLGRFNWTPDALA